MISLTDPFNVHVYGKKAADIYINGVKTNILNPNPGVHEFSPDLGVGEYTITAVLEGDENYTGYTTTATFKVVKNNFARVAFEELEITSVSDYLAGPTAIALVKQDANEAAKVLFDFAKDVPALQVKGALVDKEVYDKDKIEAFSKLPGKKQLIAMIASTINAPVQKLAATLQAYVDKMSEGGDTPAAAE